MSSHDEAPDKQNDMEVIDPIEEAVDQKMSDVDGQSQGDTNPNQPNETGGAAGFFKKKRKDMTSEEREEDWQGGTAFRLPSFLPSFLVFRPGSIRARLQYVLLPVSALRRRLPVMGTGVVIWPLSVLGCFGTY